MVGTLLNHNKWLNRKWLPIIFVSIVIFVDIYFLFDVLPENVDNLMGQSQDSVLSLAGRSDASKVQRKQLYRRRKDANKEFESQGEDGVRRIGTDDTDDVPSDDQESINENGMESVPIGVNPRARRTGPSPTCLIAYHVPKTGGTSLEEYLHVIKVEIGFNMFNWNYFFDRKQPYTLPTEKNDWEFKFEGYTKNMIHKGHLTPNFENYTGTQNCAKMTILREPVDRVISAFYFHKHRTHEWTNCLYSSCRLQFEYLNDCVRRFANRGIWWNSFVQDRYVVGTLPNDLDQDALEEAKATLDKFDYVCFLSDMKECLERMTKNLFDVELELPNLKKLPLGGGRNRKYEVSEDLRKQIAKANALDTQLYEWAVQRFKGY